MTKLGNIHLYLVFPNDFHFPNEWRSITWTCKKQTCLKITLNYTLKITENMIVDMLKPLYSIKFTTFRELSGVQIEVGVYKFTLEDTCQLKV